MSEQQPDEFYVIDTDSGVDDAQALVLALTHQRTRHKVSAITCCYGNIGVDLVCGNVFRVLSLCQRTEIPVFIGCDRSLTGVGRRVDEFHGTDGFGGIADTISIAEFSPKSEHASVALVRMANEKPGSMVLIALGPLTNLALAQRLDNKFGSNLKRLIIMGGNIGAEGNITGAAEFNFYCDPEAAAAVLKEFVCPKLCIPWETCQQSFLSWEWYNKVTNSSSKYSKFMKDLTADIAKVLKGRNMPGYYSCDLFAMATVVDEKVCTRTEHRFVQVEITGKHTRGQMVVERRVWATVVPNLEIVVELDLSSLQDIIEKALK